MDAFALEIVEPVALVQRPAGLSPMPRLPSSIEAEYHPALVYLGSLAPGPSRESMASALRLVAGQLGFADPLELPWGELRYPHVALVRSRLVASELAPATVNRLLSAMLGVLAAAWRSGQLPDPHYQRLRGGCSVPGSRLPRGRNVPYGELQRLFAVCADDTPAGARDAALIVLLFAAGLRRSEAAGLPFSGLDRERWVLRVIGKGDVEREVPLRGAAVDAIAFWLAMRGVLPGYLVCQVTKGQVILPDFSLSPGAVRLRLERRAVQARIPSCSPHDLRRSFVTQLLDGGVDLNIVRGLAGHAGVQTTARYDRRDARAAERAVEVLHTPWVRPGCSRSAP